MNRKEQLEDLIGALEKLTAILKHDKGCQWIHHFESCLDKARQLRDYGFEQKDLNYLSVSVMSVFGGMGSFNDYVPVSSPDETGNFEAVQGMEDFPRLSNLVYNSALGLREAESE